VPRRGEVAPQDLGLAEADAEVELRLAVAVERALEVGLERQHRFRVRITLLGGGAIALHRLGVRLACVATEIVVEQAVLEERRRVAEVRGAQAVLHRALGVLLGADSLGPTVSGR
jgi:hypothetical protein